MVNVTIDDSSPLVTYYPTGGWNSRSASNPCPACTANPDTDLFYDRTFHDGTFYPLPGITNFPNVPLTASIVFNGTAVYVFCALAQSSNSPDGDSDMSFYIDGSLKDTFVKIAPGNNDTYNYSVNVFSIDSLIPGSHNLTLQNGQVNGFKSLMLLDEIVYTTVNNFTLQSPTSTTTPSFSAQTSTSSDSSSSIRSHRIVVGLAIAVPVIAVLLAALGLIFFLKQRKQRYEKSGTSPRPFEPTAARTIEPFLTLPHSNLSHPMSSIPSQQTHPSNRFHAGLSGAHRAYAPTELQASGYTSSIPGVTSEEQPSPRHALTSRSVGGGFGSNQAPPSYANLSGLEPPPAYDMSKAA
ncbi:hypothetical protein DFJ43DRAFT_594779 [Lentinula guzmanii]|uniref:Uncharacterized protein n=1 Tax=Lentinula guzmanii TaxID=2804957 RepID=A0AA38JB10_9AGAR|nr:hypothetical protein DFJ43DRAFT_594779 [Lentinula guzmanii]